MKHPQFADFALPLYDWLPDESVFSLVSRLHLLWGHPLSSTTSSILFGHARSGVQHDLPTRLTEFSQRTQGQLGGDKDIAAERTLVRYYRCFLSAAERDHLVTSLCGPTIAHLKLRLGLLTSRFRANHPLKACPQCMAEDLEHHGTAYWHLRHQYPGVWVCLTHHALLQESIVKSTGVGRFQWHLPAEDLLRSHADEMPHAPNRLEALNRLAQIITNLVEATVEECLAPENLVLAYRSVLAQRGWLTTHGSLRMNEIAEDFTRYVIRLRDIPELQALPSSANDARIQLGRLLRPPRGGTHPIRHFVLIDWLFGNAQSFLETYARCMTAVDTKPEQAVIPEITGAPTEPSIQIREWLDAGMSLRAIAGQLNVDVGTVMAWAAKCGLSFARRPKVLVPTKRQALIRCLTKGMDKAEAARRHGISEVTVTRVLRTEPGLQSAWHQARYNNAQALARARWLEVVTHHGQLGTKYLRGLEPAAYAWLYRNDRPWLQQSLPPMRKPDTSSHLRIDWGKRDEALARKVEETALELAHAHPGKPLKLWQLYQHLPELKAKLGALDRLPLTRRILDRVTGKATLRFPDLLS